MLKTLPKTSHQLTVCEGNFLRLKRMLQKFSKETYFFQTINPDESYNEIYCPWLELQKKIVSDVTKIHNLESDRYYLLCERKQFLVHKTILSSKSSKIEAAIHFC